MYVACVIVVKYAAAVGKCTLDMEELLSRDEVYKYSWFLDGDDGECEKMDVEEVFIPESQCYHVVSIVQGLSIAVSLPQLKHTYNNAVSILSQD